MKGERRIQRDYSRAVEIMIGTYERSLRKLPKERDETSLPEKYNFPNPYN
jgi:hypothetical protein